MKSIVRNIDAKKKKKKKKILEEEINSFISTGIEWIPKVFLEVNKNEKSDILSFLEAIEDNDDVQNVYNI